MAQVINMGPGLPNYMTVGVVEPELEIRIRNAGVASIPIRLIEWPRCRGKSGWFAANLRLCHPIEIEPPSCFHSRTDENDCYQKSENGTATHASISHGDLSVSLLQTGLAK